MVASFAVIFLHLVRLLVGCKLLYAYAAHTIGLILFIPALPLLSMKAAVMQMMHTTRCITNVLAVTIY